MKWRSEEKPPGYPPRLDNGEMSPTLTSSNCTCVGGGAVLKRETDTAGFLSLCRRTICDSPPEVSSPGVLLVVVVMVVEVVGEPRGCECGLVGCGAIMVWLSAEWTGID